MTEQRSFHAFDGTEYIGEIVATQEQFDALGYTEGTAPPIPREDQRRHALARVDEEHALFLVAFTGGATGPARDTWKVKEEAARAFEAGTATAAQTEMLSEEAQGGGQTVAQLAAHVIAKAEVSLPRIGKANGIRAKARAAIKAATDEAVPLGQVTSQIAAVFDQLEQDVQAAIGALNGGS